MDRLSGQAQEIVSRADNFNIATHHSEDPNDVTHGVDVSHRGGKPGFVRIDDDRVGNFQCMVRIADGRGIPLDAPLQMISADVRDELRLERYGTSANTPPPGLLVRTLGPLVRSIAPRAVKFISRRMGART